MDANGVIGLIETWSAIMQENRERLIEMDGIVGDSDLGLTMSDGFKAAADAAAQKAQSDIGTILYFAGKAMSTTVPSTMGTLMASGLMNAGKVLKGREELDVAGVAELFQAYLDGVMQRGKAKPGEKTFVDGMYGAVESLRRSAMDDTINMYNAACAAVDEAEKGYRATQGMLAAHGRAATRGENSRSLLDPGAAVAVLLMNGFKQYVETI